MPHSFIEEFKTQYLAIHPPALESLIRLARGPESGILPKALVPDPGSYPCYLQKQGSTAVIAINGPISCSLYYFGTNIQVITRDFLVALHDKEIETIVLHISSPGGVLTGVAEFARMVYLARGRKKIVGYAQGICASAALWIYSACGIRITDSMALLGSVGVMFQFEDNSEYLENQGIRTYTVVSRQSPKKTLSPASPEGKAAFQKLADEMGDEFISSVALYTGVSAETVKNDFGQGFVMKGGDAVKAGMADEVGTMADVLNGTIMISNNQPKGEAMAKENESSQPAAEVKTETPAAEQTTTPPAAQDPNPKPAEQTPTGSPAQPPAAGGDDSGSVEQKIVVLAAANEKMLGLLEEVVGQNKTVTARIEELKKENETLRAENRKLGDLPDEPVTPKANGLSEGIERGY
ncbi:S49 family peptidase [bacterium]|nr:S49 family peptidase [bacterium]